MKRLVTTISLAIIAAATAFQLAAQSNSEEWISQVLTTVNTSNPKIKAEKALIERDLAAASAEFNLADPTINYAHLWGQDNAHDMVGELVVSQEFDLPNVYVKQNQLMKQRRASATSQLSAKRQAILLEAKELCLDIIWRNKMQVLLEQRFRNAQRIKTSYEKRLKAGDGNIIEQNKIEIELLDTSVEMQENEQALAEAIRALQLLADNEPLGRFPNEYPIGEALPSLETLIEETKEQSAELDLLAQATKIARAEVSLSRQKGWPKVELGYRRNIDGKKAFNGFLVGVSIPLFSNRNQVVRAKANERLAALELQTATTERRSDITIRYAEAMRLEEKLESYRKLQDSGFAIETLQKALDGGELNVLSYCNEVAALFQTASNMMSLEVRLEKAKAQLLSYRL